MAAVISIIASCDMALLFTVLVAVQKARPHRTMSALGNDHNHKDTDYINCVVRVTSAGKHEQEEGMMDKPKQACVPWLSLLGHGDNSCNNPVCVC